MKKPIEKLSGSDLVPGLIWEFAEENDDGEIFVNSLSPSGNLESILGKLISTEIIFSNGERRRALIGNINPNSPRATKQFLTVSMPIQARWFTLARYFDVNYNNSGPDALARLLGISLSDLFPIAYDITPYAIGHVECLKGVIDAYPVERLTKQELVKLSLTTD